MKQRKAKTATEVAVFASLKIILRKFDFDIDKCKFLCYAIKAKFNTEAYRSGHNEAVLKFVLVIGTFIPENP